MSKPTKDQIRIKQLENELLEMRNLFMLKIERIQTIVGIDDDYVHEPVERLDLEK
jgi:hypothetical protein